MHKIATSVLDVLKREGFIEAFQLKKPDEAAKGKKGAKVRGLRRFPEYEVHLKYYSSGEPVIRQIVRVSKPGRRVYLGSADLPKVMGGLGISVISTPEGVLSDREARRKKIGGEILALVG
jgi:small subunit ribosomal protein S8